MQDSFNRIVEFLGKPLPDIIRGQRRQEFRNKLNWYRRRIKETFVLCCSWLWDIEDVLEDTTQIYLSTKVDALLTTYLQRRLRETKKMKNKALEDVGDAVLNERKNYDLRVYMASVVDYLEELDALLRQFVSNLKEERSTENRVGQLREEFLLSLKRI